MCFAVVGCIPMALAKIKVKLSYTDEESDAILKAFGIK